MVELGKVPSQEESEDCIQLFVSEGESSCGME
uniref:Uncharacterized protein n=1 Tax=Anopheles minimus TaxID=112268 RepID=A0A182WNG3_9DIPT